MLGYTTGIDKNKFRQDRLYIRNFKLEIVQETNKIAHSI